MLRIDVVCTECGAEANEDHKVRRCKHCQGELKRKDGQPMGSLDLKAVLMDLGNKLVQDCGYDPGADIWTKEQDDRTTTAIIYFTQFLNHSPEARVYLKGEYGLDFTPLPEPQPQPVVDIDVDWVCDDYAGFRYWAGAGHGSIGGTEVGKLYAVRREDRVNNKKEQWLSTRADCFNWLRTKELEPGRASELLARADIALEAKENRQPTE